MSVVFLAHHSAAYSLWLLQPTRTSRTSRTSHVRHGPRVGPERRAVGATGHHAVPLLVSVAVIPGGAGLQVRGRGASEADVGALRALRGVEIVEVQAEGQEPQDLAGFLALLLKN